MPVFYKADFVPFLWTDLYDESGEWTGDLYLKEDPEFRLEVQPLREMHLHDESYSEGIEIFLEGAVSESRRVLGKYGISGQELDEHMRESGNIPIQLESYEIPAGVYAAARIIELAEFVDLSGARLSTNSSHALMLISQYAMEVDLTDFLHQHMKRTGEGGGRTKDKNLAALAAALASELGRDNYTIESCLYWIEDNLVVLDSLAPDCFGWKVDRNDKDLYGSKIHWKVEVKKELPKSASPLKKPKSKYVLAFLGRDADDDESNIISPHDRSEIINKNITAHTFLYEYVKKIP